jgi:hypothetical protein
LPASRSGPVAVIRASPILKSAFVSSTGGSPVASMRADTSPVIGHSGIHALISWARARGTSAVIVMRLPSMRMNVPISKGPK